MSAKFNFHRPPMADGKLVKYVWWADGSYCCCHLKGIDPHPLDIIQLPIVAPINYASKVIAPISDSFSILVIILE